MSASTGVKKIKIAHKGGKGKGGKSGAAPAVLKDQVVGIPKVTSDKPTDPSLRRLAYRGGAHSLSMSTAPILHHFINQNMRKILEKAAISVHYGGRTTFNLRDLNNALKALGKGVVIV